MYDLGIDCEGSNAKWTSVARWPHGQWEGEEGRVAEWVSFVV